MRETRSLRLLSANGSLVSHTAANVLVMADPLTADDVLPLVQRLTPQERFRLLQLITASPRGDASSYKSIGIRPDEFSSDEDSLSWEGEGWENIG